MRVCEINGAIFVFLRAVSHDSNSPDFACSHGLPLLLDHFGSCWFSELRYVARQFAKCWTKAVYLLLVAQIFFNSYKISTFAYISICVCVCVHVYQLIESSWFDPRDSRGSLYSALSFQLVCMYVCMYGFDRRVKKCMDTYTNMLYKMNAATHRYTDTHLRTYAHVKVGLIRLYVCTYVCIYYCVVSKVFSGFSNCCCSFIGRRLPATTYVYVCT